MQVGGIYEQRDAQSITYILDNPSLIYPTGYKVLQSQGGKGVLKCNHLTHNGKDKLVYDISKYKTVVSLATVLDEVAFLHVFINLLDSVIMVKNNGFMQYDNVDLNFENIYVDSISYRTYLLYVPVNIGSYNNDIMYFEDRFRYCANDFFTNYLHSNAVTLMEIRNIICNKQNRLEDMRKSLIDLSNSLNQQTMPPEVTSADKSMSVMNSSIPSAKELANKLNSMQNTSSINYENIQNAVNRQAQGPMMGVPSEVKETMDISDLLREIQKHVNVNYDDTNPYDGRNKSLNSLNNKNLKKMNGNGPYNDFDESSIGVDAWQQRKIEERQRRNRQSGGYDSRNSCSDGYDRSVSLDDRSRSKKSVRGTANKSYNSSEGSVGRSIQAEIRLISDIDSGELEFVIDKDEFVLGKNFNVVDGFIPYNEGISRVHCKIIYDGYQYSLVDLGSLNGTYINGARIPVKSHVPISIGDVIGIANLEFLVEAI